MEPKKYYSREETFWHHQAYIFYFKVSPELNDLKLDCQTRPRRSLRMNIITCPIKQTKKLNYTKTCFLYPNLYWYIRLG